jgi:hypothetical protein
VVASQIPPLHQREREESQLAIRGNPQNRICKEIALQRPEAGKFDYLSAPNHPSRSTASEFFTDDEESWSVTGLPFLQMPASWPHFLLPPGSVWFDRLLSVVTREAAMAAFAKGWRRE